MNAQFIYWLKSTIPKYTEGVKRKVEPLLRKWEKLKRGSKEAGQGGGETRPRRRYMPMMQSLCTLLIQRTQGFCQLLFCVVLRNNFFGREYFVEKLITKA